MQIRYQKLKGMEILANKEGQLLGAVRRLLFDTKNKVLIGFAFKGKVKSGEQWIKVSDVERVGKDVIFLMAADNVCDNEAQTRDVKELIGLPVNTLDGKKLGSLEDLVFETESWNVTSVVLDSKRTVEVKTDAVFGEDFILLHKGASENLSESLPEQSGFFARVFQSESVSSGKK